MELKSLQSLPSSLTSLSSLKILHVRNAPQLQMLLNILASMEKLVLDNLKSLQSSGPFRVTKSIDISGIVIIESDHLTSKVDQNSSNDNVKHQLYCSSDYEGDESNTAEEDPYDEPKPKQRLSLSTVTNPPLVFRTVKQPKVVMQNAVAVCFVYDINYDGRATEAARGAPIARIAVNMACWDSGCYDADLLAAFNNAIEDGVDIISLSLGPESPHGDFFNVAISVGSMISVFVKLTDMIYAGKLFDEMTKKNIFLWNALFGEFSSNQLPQMALEFVDGISSSLDKEFIPSANYVVISTNGGLQIGGNPKELNRLMNKLADRYKRSRVFDPGICLLSLHPF